MQESTAVPLHSVIVDSDFVQKEIDKLKAVDGDCINLRWDTYFALGLNAKKQNTVTVDFNADNSIVLTHYERDRTPLMRVTMVDNRIEKLEEPNESGWRKLNDYEYTKGGQVHVYNYDEDGVTTLERDIRHPASINVGSFLVVALLALANAPDVIKERFSEEALSNAIKEGKRLREETYPQTTSDYLLNVRVLGTEGFKRRAGVKNDSFDESVSSANHPLTITIDALLGNCLSEMPMTTGCVQIAHNNKTQQLAIAGTSTDAIKEYLSAAKEYLNRQINKSQVADSESLPRHVEFVPKEPRLLELSQRIHSAAVGRMHG